MKRMKALFERKLDPIFANMETVLELNSCRIEAYPKDIAFDTLGKELYLISTTMYLFLHMCTIEMS